MTIEGVNERGGGGGRGRLRRAASQFRRKRVLSVCFPSLISLALDRSIGRWIDHLPQRHRSHARPGPGLLPMECGAALPARPRPLCSFPL